MHRSWARRLGRRAVVALLTTRAAWAGRSGSRHRRPEGRGYLVLAIVRQWLL